MPSKNEYRRQNLFNALSQDLASIRPDLTGQYVCPLCLMHGFTEADVLGPSPRLTEEHCIPDGLGATVCVLTCAECNNKAGTNIDSELHKKVELEAFWRATQRRPLNVRMMSGGRNIGVEVKRSGGDIPRTDIRIIANQSNEADVRKDLDAAIASAKSGVVPDPMELHFNTKTLPQERLAQISLLKAGYLLLFKRLGYGPIYLPFFEPVRHQIRDPKSQILNVASIVLRQSIPAFPHAICRISTSDAEGLSVPVVLSKYDVRYDVIMPSNEQTYEKWDASYRHHRAAGAKSFKVRVLPLDENRVRGHLVSGPPLE